MQRLNRDAPANEFLIQIFPPLQICHLRGPPLLGERRRKSQEMVFGSSELRLGDDVKNLGHPTSILASRSLLRTLLSSARLPGGPSHPQQNDPALGHNNNTTEPSSGQAVQRPNAV